MSVPPQAIAPNPHTNLLNVYVQIANKMGFQQRKKNVTNRFGVESKGGLNFIQRFSIMYLWSSGQSSWLRTRGPGFLFPALPDFVRISGSGTGSTQPRESTEELIERESGFGVESR
jgi:hypothetical protein